MPQQYPSGMSGRVLGYNRRGLAEAVIGRYKRAIDDALHSRTDARRATEESIAVRVLNRMRLTSDAHPHRVGNNSA
jgi:hypothetical protein